METLQKQLFDWLNKVFGFTAGKDSFQNRLPSTAQVGDQPAMWLVENDTFVRRQFTSHSKLKEYSFVLNYRDIAAQKVKQKILELEQVLNHLECFSLPDYEVISIVANNFGADQDPDAQKFTRGEIYLTLVVLDNYEIY